MWEVGVCGGDVVGAEVVVVGDGVGTVVGSGSLPPEQAAAASASVTTATVIRTGLP